MCATSSSLFLLPHIVIFGVPAWLLLVGEEELLLLAFGEVETLFCLLVSTRLVISLSLSLIRSDQESGYYDVLYVVM